MMKSARQGLPPAIHSIRNTAAWPDVQAIGLPFSRTSVTYWKSAKMTP